MCKYRLGPAAAITLGTLIYGCGVTHVSFYEAEKVGDNYFRTLETGDTSAVMLLYSSEFTDDAFRAQWAQFLNDKVRDWGSCQSHSLEREDFVPRVKDDPTIPADQCFAMKYQVSYSTRKVQETLVLCPDPRDAALRVIGHKLEREGMKPLSVGMEIVTTTHIGTK